MSYHEPEPPQDAPVDPSWMHPDIAHLLRDRGIDPLEVWRAEVIEGPEGVELRVVMKPANPESVVVSVVEQA
jgi:hypothetical protein